MNNALAPYVTLGEDIATIANEVPYLYDSYRYGIFGLLVFHRSTWDIKRKASWESTIGTPFPGVGVPIIYSGMLMTPDNLGNYIYGYLGAAFGISYSTLIDGSIFAACIGGSMNSGAGINNAVSDWNYIRCGYVRYFI